MCFQQQKRAHLIRGIFGSGKSQTLVQVISELYYKTNFNLFRILIITVTNTAVDNLIERLKETKIPSHLIQRLGTGSSNEEITDVVKREFSGQCFITATTCASVSKCKQQQFSLLIVDEASQMRVSELLYIANNVKVMHVVI